MPKKEALALPEYLDCPAFLVVDSVITEVNDAAQKRFISVGTNVLMLISFGIREYESYKSGKLYLQLEIAGIRYHASVVCYHTAHLFCLHPSDTTPELQALTLAATQMRAPLQDALNAMHLLTNSDCIENNAEVTHLIGTINRNLYQLLRNVGNMSDAGPFPEFRKSNFEYLDMRIVFAAISEKLQNKLSSVKRNFRFTGLSTTVYTMMDSQAIERAICNLVSNAIKFSPSNGTISITASHTANRLYISVENTCSNSDLTINRLFDRYLREPGIEDRSHGIGLGLPVVRSIAIGHGGTLLVDQNKSNSIRFTMSLAVRSDCATTLYSQFATRVDFTGGFDTASVELSEVLSDEEYWNP